MLVRHCACVLTAPCLSCVLFLALLLLPQPDSGRLEAYRPPGGPGIRLDSAVTAGNVVSRYYDSLLSKVISSAPTFDKAVQRMARALQEFQVRGGGWLGCGGHRLPGLVCGVQLCQCGQRSH